MISLHKVDQYVRLGGGDCLACGSRELAYSINADRLRRWVTCGNCSSTWVEELQIYTVSNFNDKSVNKIDEAYKIVTYENGNFVSITQGLPRVHYSMFDWTEAPRHLSMLGFHLTGFHDLEKALQFYRQSHNEDVERQIWKVKAIEQQAVPEYRLSPGNVQLAARTGEDVHDNTPLGVSKLVWPEGTVMYKRMKLESRLL